jgi:hypothetical protein
MDPLTPHATVDPDQPPSILNCWCLGVMPAMSSDCEVEDEYDVTLICGNCHRVWLMRTTDCILAPPSSSPPTPKGSPQC